MTRLLLLSLVLLLDALFLTGCWDRREIEERTSVVAIGIDVVEDREDLLKITVQIPIPLRIAGSTGGGQGPAVQIMSTTGHTVAEGLSNLQKRLNQNLFFGHTRIIAIGEAVAKRGIGEIIDGFRRDPQIRRLLWPILVHGEAAKLLEITPELSQIPTVFIMDLIQSGVKNGTIPEKTLGNFFIDLSTQAKEPMLIMFDATKEDILWKGVAIFRENKYVGTLNEKETWVLLQLSQNKTGGEIILPHHHENDRTGYTTFRPKKVNSNIKVNHNENKVFVDLEVNVQGNIIETTYPIDFTTKETISKLQNELEKAMEQEAKQLIDKLQKEFQSDQLGIGMRIKAFHYKDLWEKIKWEEVFPEAEIKVKYNVKLRRFGMEMK